MLQKLYVIELFLFYRFNELNETEEEKKETISKKKKKKKKKPIKDVFKVEEVSPENNNETKNIKENYSNQFKDKAVEDCEKNHTSPSQKSNKITKTRAVKKLQKMPIKNGNKVAKNVAKGEIIKKSLIKNGKKDVSNNKKLNKNIQKGENQKGNHTPDSKKMNKVFKKGEKRKLDHIKNGPNKKPKFSDKKFKSNKEPSALESMTDDRLLAYGINPKKFRNKLKFGNKQ